VDEHGAIIADTYVDGQYDPVAVVDALNEIARQRQTDLAQK
jgi:hypothetical protein